MPKRRKKNEVVAPKRGLKTSAARYLAALRRADKVLGRRDRPKP